MEYGLVVEIGNRYILIHTLSIDRKYIYFNTYLKEYGLVVEIGNRYILIHTLSIDRGIWIGS